MLTGRLFQFSRKSKDVQISPPQANQPRGAPNGSQLRQRKSFTDGLAQASYGTWSGPPALLSPAVSTTRSTFAEKSASVYSYAVASGPSRDQILQRAAERGPTDTVTFVPISFLPFSPPSLPPNLRKASRFEQFVGADRSFSVFSGRPLASGTGWRSQADISEAFLRPGFIIGW